MEKKERKQQIKNSLKSNGVNCFRVCLLIIVFIWCITNGVGEDGINFEKIVDNINTYFMYTFIFCNYILIKTKGLYSIKKEVKKLTSIDDIEKQSLSRNFDRDSVKVVSRGNVHFIYDTRKKYYQKIEKTFKVDIVILSIILICVVCILHSDIQKCFLYTFQMVVTAFANIVLLISEIEGKELCFSVFNLSTCSEKNINDGYNKLQTNVIQKEEIIYYGKQPYLVIHYIKVKKVFRCLFHCAMSIILLIGLILSISDFIDFNKSQFLLQLYPSLILLVIGYFDIANIRQSIFQHKVSIHEIENISSYKEQNGDEKKVLFYEIDESKKNNNKVKYYQLLISQMSESCSLWERFKSRRKK